MSDEYIEPDNENAPDVCPICLCELDWVDCWECEDGYVDLYEEDPIMFGPGEVTLCQSCHGRGGHLECPCAENHARILEEQKRGEK